MEEGLRLRLMICEQCKLLSLQEKMEMLNRGVGIEEFSVKGRELGFSIGEFLRKESQWSPGTMNHLLEQVSAEHQAEDV